MTGQNGRDLLVAGAYLHLLKVTGALAEVEVTGARSNAGSLDLESGWLRRSRANQPLLLDQAPPLLHNPPHPARRSQAQRPWLERQSSRVLLMRNQGLPPPGSFTCKDILQV